MKNHMEKISMIIIILSTMVVMSSNNFMSMWMGVEMNMLAFISYIKNKSKKSSQAKMNYFLIQTISSIMFLFTIINSPMMNYTLNNEVIYSFMITLSMMMKMGAAPLHMWFINMMEMIKWNHCMMIATWQKLSPMFILTQIINNNMMINTMSIMSIIMGAIGGINQTHLKKLMAFSSINHIGWMIACINYNNEMWMKYLLIYSIISIMIMWIFKNQSINMINQMNVNFKSKMEKIGIIILFLSMAGIPPFTGFIGKWIVIESLMKENMKFMLMIMIMSSMITSYYYLRMISPILMMNSIQNKWNKSNNNMKIKTILMTNMLIPLTMIMNMI